MSRLQRGILIAIVIVMVLSGAAVYIDRSSFGIPGFLLWKSISSAAHGGRYADVNGTRIYYETFGAGPPVLVLHGGSASLESMHYEIRALAKDHLVIAPDSRAHGRSPDSDDPLSYAQMSDDMLKLLDPLQIQKADVVGWSDGGIIGLDLAMNHPGRVGRLVAIGANYNVDGLEHVLAEDASPDAPQFAPLRDFYRRIAPNPDHWPVFFHKVVAMWHSQPSYTTSDLGRIQAPTLIVAGEHDAIKREHTDAMAKAIPGATELIVADATHLAPLERPGEVSSAVVEFLAAPPSR